MTIALGSRIATFAGSGTTGPFTFTFPVISTGDITVTHIVDSTGARTTYVLTTNYTIVAVDAGLNGGTITTVVALASGETLLVDGNTPLDQPTDYANQGEFSPESHEKSFDKLTQIAIEQDDNISNAIKFPLDVTTVSGTIVGTPVAGRPIELNSTATALVVGSASISDALNSIANSLEATSVTSNNITTGSKTFTLDIDVFFPANMPIQISNTLDTTEKLFGTVTSYVASTKVLTVNIDAVNGAGSGIITWQIIATGPQNQIAASATTSGIVELTTAAEVNTGTDTSRAVTAGALSDSDMGLWMFEFFIAAPVVGNGSIFFETPSEIAGMNIVSARAQWGNTIGTGAATSIQLHNTTQVADVFSTNLTLDAGERSSSTAAAAVVIDAAQDDITLNDVYQIDIDVIGSTVPGTDLLIQIFARIP